VMPAGPPAAGRTLGALAAVADSLAGVRRGDLEPGERLVVATRNSIYCLVALADGRFSVTGGWLARGGHGERTLAVGGCTFGGRALLTDMVAAAGLVLEFGDGTATTRIRSVRRILRDSAPPITATCGDPSSNLT
jgi:hypothetical protein